MVHCSTRDLSNFGSAWRLVALSAIYLFISITGVASAEVYRLGVQDKLKIHVSEWPALTGEFSVGAGGDVSLPILGQIPAAGLDTRELSEEIATRLQDKMKLRGRPDTAVDIATYRPFYILGQVTMPGEYSYRPGMVVLNALSLAGGLYRTQRGSEWALDASAINSTGQLTLLRIRKFELQAEEQRLQLEAAGIDEFPPYPLGAAVELIKAIDGQKLLFDARLQRFHDEIRALKASLGIHEREVVSLDAQMLVADANLVAAKRELATIRSLTDRGLASNRVYPMERSVAEVERELGEMRINKLRAERDINEVTAKMSELTGTRQSDALGGLQSIKTQHREIDKQVESLEALLQSASSYSADLSQDQINETTPVLTYSIVRTSGESVEQIAATEVSRVLPGDIIKVERLMPKVEITSEPQEPQGTNVAQKEPNGPVRK